MYSNQMELSPFSETTDTSSESSDLLQFAINAHKLKEKIIAKKGFFYDEIQKQPTKNRAHAQNYTANFPTWPIPTNTLEFHNTGFTLPLNITNIDNTMSPTPITNTIQTSQDTITPTTAITTQIFSQNSFEINFEKANIRSLLENTLAKQSELNQQNEEQQQLLQDDLEMQWQNMADEQDKIHEKLKSKVQQLPFQLEDKLQQMVNRMETESEQMLLDLTKQSEIMQQQIQQHLETTNKQIENKMQLHMEKTIETQQQLETQQTHLDIITEKTIEIQRHSESIIEVQNIQQTQLEAIILEQAHALEAVENNGKYLLNIKNGLNTLSIAWKKCVEDLQAKVKLNEERITQLEKTMELKAQENSKKVEETRLQTENNTRLITKLLTEIEQRKHSDKTNPEINTLTQNTQNTDKTNNSNKNAHTVFESRKGKNSPNDFEEEYLNSVDSLRHKPKRLRPNKVKPKEPSFSQNSSTNALEFIKEMNDYYEVMGVTNDKEKIANFPYFLRGNCVRWCHIQMSENTSWSRLCEEFIAQYFNRDEIAQEWEALNHKQFFNNCESFVIRAWRLQTTLHPEYDTYKKCGNIIRKMPRSIQDKVKERVHSDFNEFLSNVKEIAGASSIWYKRNSWRNMHPHQNQRPHHIQHNSPPQRSQPHNPHNTRHNPNQNYQPNYHQNNYREYKPNFKRQNNRHKFPNNRNYRKKHFNNYNNNTANNNFYRDKRNNLLRGAILLTPIANQPGTYIIQGMENMSLAPIISPRSPPRHDRTSRAESPN